jgi:hypothetical protein
VLTVDQGTTTVAILNLAGGVNYSTADFTLSAGPGGVGTMIVDPAAKAPASHIIPPAPLSPHPFIAAMAGFGTAAAGASAFEGVHSINSPPMLALPRPQMA